ncbi:MAG TPA: DUF5703 domain-containing protein [Puia sp.]|nr:DUF5703 domain-containing protein [Puia sp.]
MKRYLLVCVLLGGAFSGSPFDARAQSRLSDADVLSRLDTFNIIWRTPGPGSAESMPLGNGDIGLNAWVDPGGDLLFYISKTDAWGDQVTPDMDPWMRQGGILSKLGLVRVSFTQQGAPQRKRERGRDVGAKAFRQVLHLRQGEIGIQEGEGPSALTLRIWVDANHPVIRVEAESGQPVSVKVTLDDWRLQERDTILKEGKDNITWYHRNRPAGDKALPDSSLADITFGGVIHGPGLVRNDENRLVSRSAARRQLITIEALTATTASGRQWVALVNKQKARTDALDLATTRRAHEAWWNAFWDRSWIIVSGDPDAQATTSGYILQRYVTACAGRGAYPIKFNGSIFVVDNPEWKTNNQTKPMNADFRAWGGMYWFQNTRPMYWPRLMAGDFDMMLPLFRMYVNMLPKNAALVHKYYGHGGAYFQETTPYWGGVPYMGPEVKENWTGHYFTSILELSMMMLDYYDYTGDEVFARQYLLPLASEGLQFFDEHFGRDAEGRLLLDPDNAIEMFWKVHDPAPDLAGLRAVLSGMLVLPDNLAGAADRQRWRHLLDILPGLPKGGEPSVLLPYTGPQTAKGRNLENPELYAVYPFRLYGLGKPELDLARRTFNNRRFREKGCWNQDPIQAAMLGYADVAKEYVRFALTRKDPHLKFPAFWERAHDYEPDEDNGGNGENGLQKMLMQADGRKILLLPAWPKGWDADFKLHAPYNTTVQGRVINGKVTDLVVTPASRAADVSVYSENQ